MTDPTTQVLTIEDRDNLSADMLKVYSTLKVLAKGDTVSDRILERIKKTVTI